MNCKYCGAFLPDGTEKCLYCGKVQKKSAFGPKSKKRLKIALFATVAVLAAAAVAAVLILRPRGREPGFDSPEEAVKDFITSVQRGDMRSALDAIPDFYLSRFAASLWDGGGSTDRDELAKEFAATGLQSLYDDFEYVSATVRMMYVKNVHDGKFTELRDRLIGRLDGKVTFYIAYVDAFSQVNVVYKDSGRERSDFVTCIKYEGKWYVLVGL